MRTAILQTGTINRSFGGAKKRPGITRPFVPNSRMWEHGVSYSSVDASRHFRKIETILCPAHDAAAQIIDILIAILRQISNDLT